MSFFIAYSRNPRAKMTAIPARIPMADSALLEDCITWGASSKIRIYIIIPRVRLMRIPITKGVIMNQSEAIIRPPANVDKATPEMRAVLVVFFSCLNVEYITMPIGIL